MIDHTHPLEADGGLHAPAARVVSTLRLAPPFRDDNRVSLAVPVLAGDTVRIRRLGSGAPVAGLALERRPGHGPSMPELDEDDLTPAARGLYILRAGDVRLHLLAVERAWCVRNLYCRRRSPRATAGTTPRGERCPATGMRCVVQ